MDHRHSEKLRDLMLGEATLALLEQQRPLNLASLINELRALAARQTDEEHRKACLAAIRELRHAQVSAGEALNRRSASDDNVIH
ncbi:hypothetical protein J3D56_004118 [Erwinia persicina]|jgi:hypothetical protein|uniref:DUF2732 domain-containing protein n=2 Tax=Erwinia TaxID=551 RepID=A0ABV4E1W6_9GAMM|nr:MULTISPECIES: hypothetical protein [Erwinia]MCP1440682.1 hypothetical protein [Erwinia persicina]MDN4627887.1 hypothetical protein [Erwinia sp. PsM31]